MSPKFDYNDYEDLFDPMKTDRQARRKRKPKVTHTPKKSGPQIMRELTEPDSVENRFVTTYQPGIFEEGWLLESLSDFYHLRYITDVLARVKGGKEANVYRCQGHPSTGFALLAAKVYRPRKFRNLRNDKMYRDGRAILKANGQTVKTNDHRMMRALGKKTAFGEQVAHTSWLMYEYTTLTRLYQAGVAVPKPVAVSENTVLMEYRGDAFQAAPTLNEVALAPDEAQPLFNQLLRYIELMLQNGVIHGDLSAYNILYWEGALTIIDFPQMTDPHSNPNAYPIFQRDVERVCQYFEAQGARCHAEEIVRKLWKRYIEKDPLNKAADASRLLEN